MKISVILSTYNWVQALNIVLSNLTKSINKKSNVELIIADDGSTSSTTDLILQYQNQYNFIKHIKHEDEGFRKAIILNKAVAISQGEYLIFIDGDCVPFIDFIEEHIFLAERGYMVAGNRILLSKKFTQQIFTNPNIINNILKWRLFNWIYARIRNQVNKIAPKLRLGNGKWRYINSTNWRYPKGCNFAIWRDDYIEINGFDEKFIGWGHEDTDLFIRLLHKGIKYKSGKFSTPVLHLWHNNVDRSSAQENWAQLMIRLNDLKCIKAIIGVDKYLSKVNFFK